MPKSSIFVENLTRVTLKLEKPENRQICKSVFLLAIKSRQLCYGCMEMTLSGCRPGNPGIPGNVLGFYFVLEMSVKIAHFSRMSWNGP